MSLLVSVLNGRLLFHADIAGVHTFYCYIILVFTKLLYHHSFCSPVEENLSLMSSIFPFAEIKNALIDVKESYDF